VDKTAKNGSVLLIQAKKHKQGKSFQNQGKTGAGGGNRAHTRVARTALWAM